MAVSAGIANQALSAQRGGATGNNGAPRFGLRDTQGVLVQIAISKLAQHIGQAGHGCMTGFCLYAWQSSQQIQRVYLLGRMKLRTDQMQVATGGADMTMAQ